MVHNVYGSWMPEYDETERAILNNKWNHFAPQVPPWAKGGQRITLRIINLTPYTDIFIISLCIFSLLSGYELLCGFTETYRKSYTNFMLVKGDLRYFFVLHTCYAFNPPTTLHDKLI